MYKYILLSFVFCASSFYLSFAQVSQTSVVGLGKRGSGRYGVNVGVPHNHPASPLLFENFEGTGYATAGWGEDLSGSGGALDEDYATHSTNVLSGSQSLLITIPDDEHGYTTNSFTAKSQLWAYFQFKLLSFPVGEDEFKSVLRFEDDSGNRLFKLQVTESGALRITTGSTSTPMPAVLNKDTAYHVWLSWNNDNGTDSEATLAVSETKVQPTSGDYYVTTTGTSTATQASRVRLGGGADLEDGPNAGASFIIDYLLIDDVAIPDYP